jgi:hypothetical protein
LRKEPTVQVTCFGFPFFLLGATLLCVVSGRQRLHESQYWSNFSVYKRMGRLSSLSLTAKTTETAITMTMMTKDIRFALDEPKKSDVIIEFKKKWDAFQACHSQQNHQKQQ